MAFVILLPYILLLMIMFAISSSSTTFTWSDVSPTCCPAQACPFSNTASAHVENETTSKGKSLGGWSPDRNVSVGVYSKDSMKL